MTDEKWDLLVEQIRRKFRVTEDSMGEPDPRDHSVRQVLVFEGPAGAMKLERVSRPLVVERKPIYSKRIGSGTSYEFVYHPSERTHREQLFRWANNGWEEMDLSAIGR
jgi:hypothetical protein